MNENKRVRIFFSRFAWILDNVFDNIFEYNCWNVATVHNYGTYDRHDFRHWPADSDSLPAAPGHCHRTAEPRNWIIFSRRRPLEPTQIFRVHFVPARRAQPADSDYFSRQQHPSPLKINDLKTRIYRIIRRLRPLRMPSDFSKAKIYKINNDFNDDVYVGSTCNTLVKRFSTHKSDHIRDCKKKQFTL